MSIDSILVRSLIITISDVKLLLPSIVVAEIFNYCEPNSEEEKSELLLGILNWRKQRIPFLDLENVLSIEKKDSGKPRVVIFHSIYSTDIPFYAIIAHTMPQVISIKETDNFTSTQKTNQRGILATTSIYNQNVLLPNLEYIEKLVHKMGEKIEQ
jgi:chemosensory pili system protein ChpC